MTLESGVVNLGDLGGHFGDLGGTSCDLGVSCVQPECP